MNIDHGGGSKFAAGVIDNLVKQGHFVEQLDWRKENVDFEVILVFGFTFVSFEILAELRKKNVKIVMFPIFDRMHSVFAHKCSFFISKILRIKGFDYIRQSNLSLSDKIIVSNQLEKRDILSIYEVDESKIYVFNLGIPDDIFLLSKTVSSDLFFKEYGIRDFVVFPSAKVSSRKNQIQLLKAVEGTDLKIVFTGTDSVEPQVKEEFWHLVSLNKNVLCLPKLSREMLVSCLKCSKVCVSLSSSETAGLANLEAAFLGNNLVVNGIVPFREYLGKFATYVNKDDPEEVRNSILIALEKKYDESVVPYILENFTWETYSSNVVKAIIG